MAIVVMMVSTISSASAGLCKKQHAKTCFNSWSSLELSMELFRTVSLFVHLQSKEEAWGEGQEGFIFSPMADTHDCPDPSLTYLNIL